MKVDTFRTWYATQRARTLDQQATGQRNPRLAGMLLTRVSLTLDSMRSKHLLDHGCGLAIELYFNFHVNAGVRAWDSPNRSPNPNPNPNPEPNPEPSPNPDLALTCADPVRSALPHLVVHLR